MSAVIKAFGSEHGMRVQAFRLATAPAVAECDPVVERLLEAEARATGLEVALQEARSLTETLVARAHEDGMNAGLAAVEQREQARCEALGRGIATALDALSTRLDELDGLAAMIARKALEKVLLPSEDQGALMTAMIARQLAAVKARMVLAVRVNGADFATQDALNEIATSACRGIREVTIDPDLAPGCCKIELALGQVDLELNDQWRKLAALLDSFVDERDAP